MKKLVLAMMFCTAAIFGDVIEIQSMDQLNREISNAGTPVYVDFYATWCGPCKKLGPMFSNRASSLSGKGKFLKVDIDKVKGATSKYGIKGLPTMIVFDSSGNEMDRRSGPDNIDLYLSEVE